MIEVLEADEEPSAYTSLVVVALAWAAWLVAFVGFGIRGFIALPAAVLLLAASRFSVTIQPSSALARLGERVAMPLVVLCWITFAIMLVTDPLGEVVSWRVFSAVILLMLLGIAIAPEPIEYLTMSWRTYFLANRRADYEHREFPGVGPLNPTGRVETRRRAMMPAIYWLLAIASLIVTLLRLFL